MNKLAVYSCVLLILVLLTLELFAGSFRAVTFRQMMNVTDSLVRAEVMDKEAMRKTFRHVDGAGREIESELIYTRYRLQRKEVLYGEDPDESFFLYLPGGVLEDEGRWVSDAYELQTGWDIVVHLQRNDLNDVYFSSGSAQTVFLARQIDGQEVFVNLSDATRVESDTELLSQMRTEVGLDDWVRPHDEPPVLTYATLKSLFQDAGQ